jgi:hypothetical protein
MPTAALAERCISASDDNEPPRPAARISRLRGRGDCPSKLIWLLSSDTDANGQPRQKRSVLLSILDLGGLHIVI